MAVEKVGVVLLVGVIGVVLGSGFPCYDNLQCVAGSSLTSPYPHDKCTPEWGAFPRVNGETNELISRHFKTSLEYLLIANHFKDWKYHRPGFVNYFSKLSDDNWNEGLSLLLHMVERGGNLLKDFKIDMPGPGDATTQYQLKEVEALSRALDMERRTATKTTHLAHLANHGSGVPHDAEFADFLAERLHHNSVLRIKHLANYLKLLSDIVTDSAVDSAYAIFKFDSEYLK